MARWLWTVVLGAVVATAAPYRIVVEDATHPDLPVPPPTATPVELVVHGRTSTLRSIHIAKLGQKLPPTFAGSRMANTPGFQWYVTRHFAMKAQVPKLDEKAMIELLVVAELGYPHECRAVGREPDGIDTKRLPIVYANDMEALNAAVKTDLGSQWSGGGGGVTLHANRAAYNYWTSGGLEYHRRDLLLHENMHMIEMCAIGVGRSPVWLLEGLSHVFGQHVWDKANQRLTTAVLDRAPSNDFYDRGLANIAEKPVVAADFYESRVGEPYRPGVYVLFNQFCWSDPERLMKWRLWRDELYACGGVDLVANNRRLMQRIFGPPEAFDREWLPWLAARRNSYHWVCWGWEQDGDTVQAYGWPPAGFDYAQMDINWAPGEQPAEDPLRLDYPQTPPPALVAPVDRRADEPSLGVLLDFRGEPDKGLCGVALARRAALGTKVTRTDTGRLEIDGSRVGRPNQTLDLGAVLRDVLRPGAERLGLKVELGDTRDTSMPILVRNCREVSIDGSAIGLESKTVPLTAELQAAIRRTEGRLGLNLRFGRQALIVTLAADNGAPPNRQEITLPVNAEQRQALLSGRLSLLAKDANPRLTPYLDLVRRTTEDYDQATPSGRLSLASEDDLYGLARAAYLAGEQAPASLTELRRNLTAAGDAGLAAYRTGLPKVMADLVALPNTGGAVAALLGVSLNLGADAESTCAAPAFIAALRGARGEEVTGTVRLEATGIRLSGPALEQPVRLPAGGAQAVPWRVPIAEGGTGAFVCRAVATLTCRGQRFTLTAEAMARRSIPAWQVIGPFDNAGGATADIAHAPETEPVDLTRRYAGAKGAQVAWRKVERASSASPLSELVVDLNELYGQPENVAAYAVCWVESEREQEVELGVGSEDGFVAWVNRQRVGAVLQANRTYAARGDRCRVKLRAGLNELLLKITLSGAGWKFGADLTGLDGRPVQGLRYHPEPR